MKVAFSHDWLNGMRGGEKCLEALCELYPDSSVYTLFHERGKVNGAIAAKRIFTSPIQSLPDVFRSYRYYLPFFPKAVEAFDLKGYDLVLSTSHCVAKGIRKNKEALHVCYCFTPMRYAWGLFEEYFGRRHPFVKRIIQTILKSIRRWDSESSSRVDHFVAISQHVKDRIAAHYHREAEVIYPPADTDFYTPDTRVGAEDLYVVVSALVPYKKIELAVEAFNRLGKRLVVIGTGPEENFLRSIAKSNIEFLGWQDDAVLRDTYRRARALVFPGEEDFGIVPVEVQACGRFVIAYGKGGALETVKDGVTGVFFNEPTAESLIEAVRRFEALSLDPQDARKNALRFSRSRFKQEMDEMVKRVIGKRKNGDR